MANALCIVGRMDYAANAQQASSHFSSDRQPVKRPRPRYNSHIGIDGDSRLLPMCDGRSVSARRFKDLVGDIACDLGGVESLSEGQRQLIRRAAMMSAESERLEAMWARGEAEFNITIYATITNNLRRVFEALGLERRAKPISHTTAMTASEVKERVRRVAAEISDGTFGDDP